MAATTDNGSNVVAAFNTLNLLRISCFGHNLDLAIKKGLNITQIQRALGRCHSLVELFHRSWKKNRDLRQKQQLLNLPQHKLKGEVATRWGSTYEMVSRIVEQQQALSAVLAEDRKNWHKMPSDAEFSVLETVVGVLKPLSYLTDALSGEKEVTASAVVPLLKHVKAKCTPTTGSSRLAKEMQTTIWSDIEPRYSSHVVLDTLSIASFLDPRFKDHYLQDKEGTLLSVKGESLEVSVDLNTPSENSQSTTASPSTTEDTTTRTEAPPAK